MKTYTVTAFEGTRPARVKGEVMLAKPLAGRRHLAQQAPDPVSAARQALGLVSWSNTLPPGPFGLCGCDTILQGQSTLDEPFRYILVTESPGPCPG
jgi:hypothetical protein